MAKYILSWQETDAQFLAALLLASGGEGAASLQDVLLMVDALDGTVLSLEEVRQGLEKLVATGYVHVLKNKLVLGSAFLEHHEAMAAEVMGQEALLQLLQTEELLPEKIALANEALKKYKLQNHYQQYREQFGG